MDLVSGRDDQKSSIPEDTMVENGEPAEHLGHYFNSHK